MRQRGKKGKNREYPTGGHEGTKGGPAEACLGWTGIYCPRGLMGQGAAASCQGRGGGLPKGGGSIRLTRWAQRKI